MSIGKEKNPAVPFAGIIAVWLIAELLLAFRRGGARPAVILFGADLVFVAAAAAVTRIRYEYKDQKFVIGTALYTAFFHLALWFGGYSVNSPGYLLFLRAAEKRTLFAMILLPAAGALVLYFAAKLLPERFFLWAAALLMALSLGYYFLVYIRKMIDLQNHLALPAIVLLLGGTVSLCGLAEFMVLDGGRDKRIFAALFVLLIAGIGELILPGGVIPL